MFTGQKVLKSQCRQDNGAQDQIEPEHIVTDRMLYYQRDPMYVVHRNMLCSIDHADPDCQVKIATEGKEARSPGLAAWRGARGWH